MNECWIRERKWCGVLGIEKVGVECCWMFFTIVNGLNISGNLSRLLQYESSNASRDVNFKGGKLFRSKTWTVSS